MLKVEHSVELRLFLFFFSEGKFWPRITAKMVAFFNGGTSAGFLSFLSSAHVLVYKGIYRSFSQNSALRREGDNAEAKYWTSATGQTPHVQRNRLPFFLSIYNLATQCETFRPCGGLFRQRETLNTHSNHIKRKRLVYPLCFLSSLDHSSCRFTLQPPTTEKKNYLTLEEVLT